MILPRKIYDGGKKISGIKRHIAVDTQGLPHAIHVTTANVTDRVGALEAFKNILGASVEIFRQEINYDV